MNQITIKANAKINLSLDVIGKRADGYHEVRMVMQQIDLSDLVKVSYDNQGEGLAISLTTDHAGLPTGPGNIAYNAAMILAETCVALGQPKQGSLRIHIEKRIPVAAGLAGGSTDAAAVLLALNELWSLNLTLEQLMVVGKKLGADVPFCIMGNAGISGCALAEGIGEKLTPIGNADKANTMGLNVDAPLTVFKDCWVVLSKPPIEVSTAKIYGGLVLSDIKQRPNTEELILGLRENDWNKICPNMINVLENVTLKEYGIVMYTKNNMQSCHPEVVLMSGSGPSVFGIFVEKSAAEQAYNIIKKIHEETYLIQTL